jgi:uncharacterized membrane protein YjjP (DUF1212 family)
MRQASVPGGRVASKTGELPLEQPLAAMKDFFLNVTRYPRYLVAFGLGVAASVFEPLVARARNPVTAVALIGAAVSGMLSLGLILRAMVIIQPVA